VEVPVLSSLSATRIFLLLNIKTTLDVHSDQIASAHPGAAKAHDWMVSV